MKGEIKSIKYTVNLEVVAESEEELQFMIVSVVREG